MKLIAETRFNEILQNFSSCGSLLVVGDVGVDKYTFGEVTRISPEAPVSILEVEREWYKLGLAANVSDNLNTLQIDSTLCGVIGDDINGQLFEDLLEEKGLKTWGILRSSLRKTTLKERVTTKIQQICRIDYESKGPMAEKDIEVMLGRLSDFLPQHKALIIEDYGKGLVTEQLSTKLIKKAREQDKLVVVDPSRHTPPHYYTDAHLLKPNFAEAKFLAEALGYRQGDLQGVAHTLVEHLKLQQIVITLGEKGMALLDTKTDGQLHIIPTIATEVFDVSGAGDTVVSVISAALLAGASLIEAAWIGNCAAGVVVAKKGTAVVTLSELQKFYKNRLMEIVENT